MDIVEGGDVDTEDFLAIVDFIKNYADKHHHGKEEDMLFADMSNELGEAIKVGPVQGMLIEHDMGRRFVKLLEEAIKRYQAGDKGAKVDIIANAIGYAHLLNDHIDKENNVLYQFALRQLKDETKEKLDREFNEYESLDEHQERREKYIHMVKELQKKYNLI